jgi:hypothetical protein
LGLSESIEEAASEVEGEDVKAMANSQIMRRESVARGARMRLYRVPMERSCAAGKTRARQAAIPEVCGWGAASVFAGALSPCIGSISTRLLSGDALGGAIARMEHQTLRVGK